MDPDVHECRRCPALVDSRSRIVNGVGPVDSDLMFVGEAPGAREDEAGEPFVGRSGSVLDEILLEYGRERETVRISNCIRCRPPENRDPTVEELENCRDHLNREIEAVDPDVVVTLGKVPSEHLLGREVAVTSEAGTVERVELGDEVRTVVIGVHPAATLYDRSQEEAFETAIGEAIALAGDGNGGQSRIGDF